MGMVNSMIRNTCCWYAPSKDWNAEFWSASTSRHISVRGRQCRVWLTVWEARR